MAATFTWEEDYGNATGSPARGASTATPVSNVNWKNSGVPSDAYGSFPITAGNNSYIKYQYGKFSGTFNQISGGLFAHTAPSGSMDTGVSLFGPNDCTSDGTRPLYLTPAASTDNTTCPYDMSSGVSIGSGKIVSFGPNGPHATGKATSQAHGGVDQFTNFLPTQLRTTGAAAAGDLSATQTLTLRYDEN